MTLKSMLNLNQPNLIRNPGLKLLVLTTEAGIFCIHRPLSCIYYILKMITFLAYVFFDIICARRLTSLCIVHCVLIFLCGFLLCTGCWIVNTIPWLLLIVIKRICQVSPWFSCFYVFIFAYGSTMTEYCLLIKMLCVVLCGVRLFLSCSMSKCSMYLLKNALVFLGHLKYV